MVGMGEGVATYWCHVCRSVTTELLVVILHVEAQTEEDVVPQKHLHPANSNTQHTSLHFKKPLSRDSNSELLNNTRTCIGKK